MAGFPPVHEDVDVGPYDAARFEFERAYLAAVMRQCGENVTKAAARAGINRTDFYKRLKRFNVPMTRRRMRGNWAPFGL